MGLFTQVNKKGVRSLSVAFERSETSIDLQEIGTRYKSPRSMCDQTFGQKQLKYKNALIIVKAIFNFNVFCT